LDHQNNFVGTLKIVSNAAKNFYILATSLSILLSILIILIVQQNYFSDLYLTKLLHVSAKSFFSVYISKLSDYNEC